MADTTPENGSSTTQTQRRAPPTSYTLHAKPRQKTDLEAASSRFSTAPYPALLLSALSLAALPGARKGIRGFPSVFQCSAYTAIFAASGYALQTGDSVNGSGLAAGWSAIWLFFNARNAFKSRRLFPITMAGAIATVGSLYGYSYANIGRE
ncbi:hypothetical protein GGI12_005161 [Dipsacomyces acuminosporus]|nr:hypothetical protein GGI12_005161 [Dipsacomyces acuminosporus]